MKKITFLLMFVLSIMMANAVTTTRYIKVTATGTGDGTSWTNADGTANIQTQIDAVSTAGGGEVQFAAGTYLIAAQITIRDGVNLTGGFAADGSGTRDLLNNQTILDGQFNKRIMMASDQTLANGGANTFTKITTIDGFTMQRASSSYGSAVFMTYGVVLQNCIIRNNNGSTYGAAVMMKRTLNLSSPTTGWNMGGAIINCVIINNTSSSYTAGIYVDQNATFSIVNSVIANNKSTDATNGVGGLYVGANIRYSRITNNIFYNNSSAAASAKNNFYSPTTNFMAVYANYFSDATNPVGFDTTLTSASPAHGNKTSTDIASPNFANPTTFQGISTDATTLSQINSSDWRLKSTSGLINLGANPTNRGDLPYPYIAMASAGSTAKLYSSILTDIMGSVRINGTYAEMGAYEYVPVVVSTATADALKGSVSAGTTVSKGTSVTVTATPLSGYVFSKWNDGTTDVSTTASYTFTPSADITLTATFVTDPGTGLNQLSETNLVTVKGRSIQVNVAGEVQIYNSVGRLMISKKVIDSPVSLNSAGIYLVKMTTSQGVKVQKIVVY
jgi:hypothetical protein